MRFHGPRGPSSLTTRTTSSPVPTSRSLGPASEVREDRRQGIQPATHSRGHQNQPRLHRQALRARDPRTLLVRAYPVWPLS
jgi:hypothetical protein